MSERRDDGPIAPRRTLQGGEPVLPPPAPEQDAERQRAAKAQAAKEAREEQRRAEKEAARREREAKAEQRRQAKDEARRGKADKAAQDRAERQRAAQEKAARDQAVQEKAAQEQARREPATDPTGPTDAGRSSAPARSAGASAAKAPSKASTSGAKGGRPRTRKARLRVTQVDAWSVMKTSFLLSIALGIVLVVAVAIVWSVLGAAGVWDSINSIVQQAVGSQDGPQFDITDYVGTSRIMGFTLIVAVVDVILITAIATLGAFLYNLSAALLGGIEVTLAEDN